MYFVCIAAMTLARFKKSIAVQQTVGIKPAQAPIRIWFSTETNMRSMRAI